MSTGELAYLAMVLAVFVVYAVVLAAAFILNRLAPAPRAEAAPRAETRIARRPSTTRAELSRVG